MSSIEIGTIPTPAHPARTDAIRQNREYRQGSARTINSSDENAVVVAKAARGGAELGNLQTMNETQNRASSTIRAADRTLETVNMYVKQMKDVLFRIIKNYPPYPPGDAERAMFLRSFNGLKREIDSMTIPPNEQGAGYRAPNPGADTGSLAGRIGIPLPALPDTASDADIGLALAQLDKVRAAVGTLRSEVAGEAVAGSARGHDVKAAEFQRTAQERLALADLPEATAVRKSAELKSTLSQDAGNGLTEMQPQLLQLVG